MIEHEIDRLMTVPHLEADLGRILTLAESGISVLAIIDPTDNEFFLARGWGLCLRTPQKSNKTRRLKARRGVCGQTLPQCIFLKGLDELQCSSSCGVKYCNGLIGTGGSPR